MAIFTLESENPKFSWILRKNPETQTETGLPHERKSGNYRHYLWFESENKITVYSRIMNPKNTDGYLDYNAYSNGVLYLQAINSVLQSALTEPHEDDAIPAKLTFTLYNKNERLYSRYFPNNITEEVRNRHSYITINADSVKEALEIACVISLTSVINQPDLYIEDRQLMKYVSIISRLKCEYNLIRSILNTVRSDKLFEVIRPHLDGTRYNFGRYNAFDSRRNWYSDHAEKSATPYLLDCGCGEGRYFKLHSRYYDEITAIEADPEVHNDATHTIRKIKADNIKLVHSTIQDYITSIQTLENTDVLLTEVFEHIPFDEMYAIFDSIIALNPENVYITLPNHSFNVHYRMEPGEFRHDDHLWEPTLDSFNSICTRLSDSLAGRYTLEQCYIGDSEKENPECSTTFGIKISKI